MKTILQPVVSIMLLTFASVAWPASAEELSKMLKDKDTGVRRQAAEKLKEMGKDARPATNALIQAVRTDNDVFVRRFAAQALKAIGPDAKAAVPALVDAWRRGEEEGRTELSTAAVDALGHMGPTAVPALITVIKGDAAGKQPKGKKKDVVQTESGELRRLAAEGLGSMGKDAKAAVPVLTDLLKDREARTAAAVALGRIGPDAKSALEALNDAAGKKEKDKDFKKAVKKAIRQISPPTNG